MAVVDVIDGYVAALPGETRRLGRGEWGITVKPEQAGGWPLDVGMRLADGLLRVQAFAAPYREGIDFGQILHWNRGTRLIRFSCTESGDVWVQVDLMAAWVDEAALDRVLGLVVEGALAIRGYAGGGAG